MGIRLNINGREVEAENQKRLLEACLQAGTYIPHLCFHPGLGTARLLKPCLRIHQGEREIAGHAEDVYPGCGLCLVEIEGHDELCHSCTVLVADGMAVHTDTEPVKKQIGRNLTALLEKHPHACITCDLADGCSRQICSMDVPEQKRCCWKFHVCEFRKIASFIGFRKDVGCVIKDTPVIDDNPLFSINYNLCIRCQRCVIACRDVAGREALLSVCSDGEFIVGARRPSLKDSGCKFCLACVDVCPTGTQKEKDPKKKESRPRLDLQKAIMPPEENELKPLTTPNAAEVPDKEGVYKLYNEERDIIQITGSANLKEALIEESENAAARCYFSYEEDEMFMMRERRIIQQYMEEHRDLPPNNREIDDLF